MALPRSRMTEKGQVTIPVDIRKQMGLKPRDEVEFARVDGQTIIQPVARSLHDFYQVAPALNPPMTEHQLREAFEQGVADELMEKMKRESSPGK